ncbi:VCBS domain-containing protein [Avibacterium sp. 20-129]|uniref:VCBS domain-containing protein n=1 Tax=Avibacterium sp. 20-129 TaxID=2911525 RepID=UPI0022459A40|nr:VCBS domain-containing protein [Avibacterium sp. 20-129]MCW9697835.1 VCBS domain-containing protein [Avibacterium sp. 20-129]
MTFKPQPSVENVVKAQVTDAAGNKSAEGSDSTLGNFSDSPTFTITDSITKTPDVANIEDGNITFTVKASEAVEGLEESDFAVENGTIVSFSGSGTDYTLVVKPNEGLNSRDVKVSLPAGAAQSVATHADSASAERTQEVDNVKPVAPTATLDDTGADATDGITSDNTVAVSGIEPDASWEYSVDGGQNWTQGTGTEFSLENNRTYPKGDIQVRQTDKAGNVSDVTTVNPDKAITIDDVKPQAPSIAIPENADGGVNAKEAADGVQVEVTLPDGAKAGDVITLTVKDAENNPQTVTYTLPNDVNAKDKVTVTIEKDDLPKDGTYTVDAKVTDKAGNEGPASAPASFDLDTTAPNDTTTQITNITVAGDNEVDGTEAHQATVTVSGQVTGEFKVGDKVVITVDGKTHEGKISDADGHFSVKVPSSEIKADADKQVDVTVTATDAADNQGEVSASQSYSVLAVSNPTIAITDDKAAEVINGQEGNITFTLTPSEAVTGLANDDLSVTNGEIVGSLKDNQDGTYSVVVKPSAGLNPGDVTLTVKAGAATSVATGAETLVASGSQKVDNQAPNAPTVALENDTGTNATDNITSDGTVVVSGIEAGATVKYSTDGGKTWKDVTNGQFDLPEGVYTEDQVQVKQVDGAGNESAVAKLPATTVDTTVPKAPTLALANDTGSDTADNITKDGTVIVSGVESDTKVEYSTDGGKTWNDVTEGKFVLPEGSYEAGKVQVRQTDAAGNVSEVGKLSATTVDSTAPATPKLTLEQDTGSSSSDYITSDGVVNIGEVEPGAKLEYSSDNGQSWTTITDPHFTLPAGTYEAGAVQVRQTDAAGNVSDKGSLPKTIVDNNINASITNINVAEDNNVSLTEAATSVTVTGKVTGEFSVDDVVTVSFGGSSYTGKIINADGDFSVTVPGDGLAANNTKSLTVSVHATDKAGNSGDFSATQSYTVEDASVVIEPGQSATNDNEVTEASGVNNNIPGDPNAGGKLIATQGSESVNFVPQSSVTGTYGTFTLNADGTWSYTLDNNRPATQALNTNDTVQDKLTVTTVKGGSYDIVVNVQGADDKAVISGDTTGVAKDGSGASNTIEATPATGKLTVTDVDNADTWNAENGNGANGYGSFTIDAQGNWSYTADQSNAKVNQLKQGETLTDTFTVTTAGGDQQVVTVTIQGQSATAVQQIGLVDDFTDDFGNETNPHNPQQEASNVADLYPNRDATPYEGTVSSGLGDTALSKETGLTNDATPTLTFTLDHPLDSNQTIVVKRYKVGSELSGGQEYDETEIPFSELQTTDGQTYTFTDNLAETYGQDYRYKVEVLETIDGVQTEAAKQEFNFRLDTLVESMVVERFNTDTTQMVLKATGNSEKAATITFEYVTGTGAKATGTAVYNEQDGTYTFNMPNWNRYTNDGITLTVVDAAGNVNTQKVMAIRNLFTEFSTEAGPNTNHHGSFDDGIITNSFGDEQSTHVVSHAEGGLTASEGNDALVIGLEQFGGFGLYNGSIGNTPMLLKHTDFKVDTGTGDDHIQVRGDTQSFYNKQFTMGEGNDKFSVDKNILAGDYTIDMGNGHNIVAIAGAQVKASTLSVEFGDGNDLMSIGTELDGNTTINFGDGDNSLSVGNYFAKNTTITAGSGNDRIEVGTNIDTYDLGGLGRVANINLGDGNNSIYTGGYIQGNTTIVTGQGEDMVFTNNYIGGKTSINLGAGDDIVYANTYIDTSGEINLGEGNDGLVANKDINGTHIIMGAGDDTLRVGEVKGSTVLDMGDGNDTVDVEKAFGSGLNSPTLNLGSGDDIATIGGDIASNAKIDGGEGNDIVKINSSNQTDDMSAFANVEILDFSGATNHKLTLSLSDLTSDNITKVYIKGGNENVTIDFGDNNDTKYDAGNNNVRYKDSGGLIQQNWNFWERTGAENVDGHQYDVYTYRSSTGETSPEQVLIESGINII